MIPEPLARPLLVFGGSGQVGRELLTALRPLGSVIAPSHAEANLEDPRALHDVIGRVRPSVIVNAAALTNVDRAEREPELARALNEEAPGAMASAARRLDALMVHYSTDYVFDGDARSPYDETATPRPINVYGATKLGGERSVAAAGGAHLIIRTSWVYSADGAGFVPTLLRQLRTPDDDAQRAQSAARQIRVVADQIGSPTWSRSLATATARILASLRRGDRFETSSDDWGIYHLAGCGSASRLEIANEVLSARRVAAEHAAHMIVPISAAEFAAAAPRPRYSALSNERTLRRFGVTLDPWRREIRRMLGALVD